MNTFSVNSLKILDSNLEEFEKKYIFHLDFLEKNENAKRGERLHGLICYYLRGFDINKIKNSLASYEKELFDSLKELEIFKKKDNFIKTEENFLVKVQNEEICFYLTGRFDAIYLENGHYTIYDWKSKNIPKNPDCDLQSIVYLYAASKMFNTQNISICYLSLETKQTAAAAFKDENTYINEICRIVKKLPKKYLF